MYLSCESDAYPKHHSINLVSPFNPPNNSPQSRISQPLRFLLVNGFGVAEGAHTSELLLSAGYVEKLAVCSMKHGKSEGKIDAHDPKLSCAWKNWSDYIC
jgi:hypothetical protein